MEGNDSYIDYLDESEEIIENIDLDEADEIIENMGLDESEDIIEDIEEGAIEKRSTDTEYITAPNDSTLEFVAHQSPVYSVDICCNQDLVLSGGGNDCGYVWSSKTGDTVLGPIGFSDSVIKVGFSYDGKYGSFACIDGNIKIVDLEAKEIIVKLEGPDQIEWLNWHKKGYFLSIGSRDGTVWMWSIPGGNLLGTYCYDTSPSTVGGFTPDGRFLVSGHENGSLRIWSPKTSSIVVKYDANDKRDNSNEITALSFYDCNNIAILGSLKGEISLVKMTTKQNIGEFIGHDQSIEGLAMSTIQPVLISGGLDGKICLWDMEQQKIRGDLSQDEPVTRLICSSDPFSFITASTSGIVRLWDHRSGSKQREFHGHQDCILDIAMKKNTIVTGSDDGTALVFHI